jgi:hypothetical protein
VLAGYRPGGNNGTRTVGGATPLSGSKSGRYAKSIVLLSWTAFREREVLKWRVERVSWDFSEVAWEDFASSIAVWTFAREGFVVVRIGETEEGPVIWRERAFRGVELAASLVRARREFALETAMFVIVEKEELRLFGCIWVLGWRWSESCAIGTRRRRGVASKIVI